MTSPLACWKLALRTLKIQLMAQANFLTLGEIEYSVTQIMSKLRGIIMIVLVNGIWMIALNLKV